MSSLACNTTDNINFVNNGVLRRLPRGFRFEPTDEELIIHYLMKKVRSCPLPADIIPELDIYKSDPWNLPGDSDDEKYFFTTNEVKYPNGNRPNRATGSGYWKSTGTDKKIVGSEGNQVVGMRKSLVFYKGRSGCSSKTDWAMHEFRLADGPTVNPNKKIKLLENSNDGAAPIDVKLIYLCKIFHLKKKKGSKDAMDGDKTRPIMFDFDLNVTPTSSSS